jgi:hypothetical protein
MVSCFLCETYLRSLSGENIMLDASADNNV